MILGRISFDQSAGFYEIFIWPWMNLFCGTMGIFSIFLFGYISAVFLVGETGVERERLQYSALSKQFMVASFLCGLLVFGAAELEGHSLFREFVRSSISISMFLLALLLCPFIWYFLRREHNKTLWLRLAIGIQVTAILVGWFYIQYPVLIQVKNGEHLTFFNTRAPDATLKQLLIALIVGLVLIIPAFIYLFKVFKIRK
jgi:cytochrome d ubiquinol oxidase subunit II